MTAFNIQNLYFKYNENDKQILENINIKIEKGSFIAILGHNGSGKSTLAKLLNGLLKPTEGDIFVFDKNTKSEEDETNIRKTVGLVFQNPDNQIVATIVEEDIAFGPENLGIPPQEIRKKVDEALKSVDMYDYRLHEPHRLSGGQKQRVAIAGILAMEPECVVFDEPTAMLDPRGRAEVSNIISHLNKQMIKTVVLITHYMNEAVKADRVIVMNNGKIAADGTPKQIFSDVELLKSIGLDVPQPTELIYELNKHGMDFKKDIIDSDECVEAITKYIKDKRV